MSKETKVKIISETYGSLKDNSYFRPVKEADEVYQKTEDGTARNLAGGIETFSDNEEVISVNKLTVKTS